MSTPILTTKLYAPPLKPDAVLRSRLIDQLNRGLHRKLTLVSAAAGFGKTTLICEWIANGERPAAWLSLDEGDSEPIRFLAYLIAALQTLPQEDETAASKLGEGALALLESPQPPPLESILTVLLNEIARYPDPFLLVLDDYHAIDAAEIHDALAFLIERQPPQMHLVFISREDPPLPLARYRARGQSTELRAAELRFTLDEAGHFLNQAMDLTLSAQDIAALEARTEGWITGLQLAALSMQGRDDTSAFVQDFAGSHSFILDYLVEEVLQRQPEPVRRFLLQTSFLDRLCGPLCDAVTRQEDGKETLAALARGNLFVVPLDDKRQWYRYHHLFADVLQTHVLDDEPEQMSILYRRASDWCDHNGLRADAIRYALAADDFERAAELIELVWPAMDRDFQSVTWLGWAKNLPDELVRDRPVLCVAYAWALLNAGELEASESWLQQAEQWLDEQTRQDKPLSTMIVVDQEQFGALPASIASARAYLAQAFGDKDGSLAHTQRALELLPQDDYIRRGPAAAMLGLAYWERGELEDAYRALADAMDGFRMAGSIAFAISGSYGLADIRISQGRLHAAKSVYDQALQLVAAEGHPLIRGVADLYLGLAELCHEHGDPEGVNRHLAKSESLGEPAALADWPYRVRVFQARVKSAEGALDQALELLDAAERRYFRSPVPLVRPVAARRARIWITQGRFVDVQEWADEQGLSIDNELSFMHEYEHITLARLLLARPRPKPPSKQPDDSIHEALTLLSRLHQAADAGGRTGSMIEILVLQAFAYQAGDDMPKTLDALKHALALAEPEGYVRVFVDEGRPMATLLNSAKKAGFAPNYVSGLLAALGETNASPPVDQPLLEPLSDRELDVLRLLGTEQSGPEIARELVISLNTLRTHTKNIYGKLGVNNRRAAVRRAQELDLS